METVLHSIFNENKTEAKRKPKSITISKEQMLKHKAKHGASTEVKAKIIEAEEIRKYGKEARLKLSRKADTRSIIVEKGTRPKVMYYNVSPITKINPLEQVFKGEFKGVSTEVVTPEAQDEARIYHFGGKLGD